MRNATVDLNNSNELFCSHACQLLHGFAARCGSSRVEECVEKVHLVHLVHALPLVHINDTYIKLVFLSEHF